MRYFKQIKPSYLKGKRSILIRLMAYFVPYKRVVIIAFLLTVLSNLCALMGPMLSGYAVDAIVGPGQVQFGKVFYYAAWMIGLYLLSSILSYSLSILMIDLSKKIVKTMRQQVFDKLLSLPVGYLDKSQSGDLMSRLTYDIDTVNASLSGDLVQMLTMLMTTTGAFIMMLTIAPKLVLIFGLTIPLSIGMTKYLTSRTRPLFRERSKQLGQLNGFGEEMISGEKTLKVYGQQARVHHLFSLKNQVAVEAYYQAEYYGSMVGPCISFINNLSLSLISVSGALLYLIGEMTIGNISSFILYSRKFSGPINEAAQIMGELQSALAAAERVFMLLDEPSEVEDGPGSICLSDLGMLKGEMTFQDVSFGYEARKDIIRHMSFKVQPGQLVAVVGPTGGGKTTLTNLLMRFYDIREGDILIEGQSIYQMTRQSLRQAFAMVLQDTWLFQGSIYENLVYGKEQVTMEEVVAATKAAQIHDFIIGLPKGYDTPISEEAEHLSKGQRQLLTIARAMLLDRPILILDEATSNVDTRTEAQISLALRKLVADKTCFVIAHRLSTIQKADQILVVDHGTVVECGTHEALLADRGFYWSLYQAQFQ